jgi:hypothetical protein
MRCPSGKMSFPNAQSAVALARVIRRDHKIRQRVYECAACLRWHLTSRKGAQAVQYIVGP